MNDGRIEIAPRYNNYSYSGSTLNGAYSGSGDVEVLSGGILTIADSLSVADFVNNGTVNGGGTLTVGGTLTPGNAIPNLTLAAGATVKLTGLNAPQAVADTFAAAGRVYVDVSALDAETLKATDNVPVLTAPSFPADFKRNLATVGANDRGFRIVTEEGVSTVYSTRQIGFTIFVR